MHMPLEKIERREVERLKTEDGVFDKFTLRALMDIISKKFIRELDFPIASGKESIVFRASTKDGAIALKIYRTFNLNLRKDIYKINVGSSREFAYALARMEFENLKKMDPVLRVPKPIFIYKNVLGMEYIGDEETPARLLTGVELCKEDAKYLFDDLIEKIHSLCRIGMVHGDLSPYNILYWKGELVVIDVSQATYLDKRLLCRDLKNVFNYFDKFLKIDRRFILSDFYLKCGYRDLNPG